MEIRHILVLLCILLLGCSENSPVPPEGEKPDQEECISDSECATEEQCLDGSCVTIIEVNQDPQKKCDTDAECICGGKDRTTGECFVGNVEYYDSGNVDKEAYCPDFCTGISGEMRTTCVAQQCSIIDVDFTEKRDNRTGNLLLQAPVREGFAPQTIKFSAELIGIPEHAEEFYCPTVVWTFGDGQMQAVTPDCLPYNAKSKITREFSVNHFYDRPGIFMVSVAVGPAISNTVTIAMREPQGKSMRCSLPNPAKGFCESMLPNAAYYEPNTQKCKIVQGCTFEGTIPFGDLVSCQLACEGGESLGNCRTAEDCVVGGCAQQWCAPSTIPLPMVSTCDWRQEYVCYEAGSCTCINRRCSWDNTVEICIANQKITAT